MKLTPDHPFARGDFRGNFTSVDGTEAFFEDNEELIKKIIKTYSTDPNDWDGNCCGIVELHDGRFVGWESGWGPTGSGFSMDAYGGDGIIVVGASENAVVRYGLSQESRMNLGYPATYE